MIAALVLALKYRNRLTGLQYFLSVVHISKVTSQFHEPCNAQVNNDPSPDGSCLVCNNAQNNASKKRADTFCQGLAKMNGAIKYRHRQNRFPACILNKGEY